MTAANQLKEIVRAIANDDALAYKQLFLLYHARLVNFAYSIIHSREAAEDVVSDVFLKIWIKRKTLTEVENPHLYLYVTIKNHSITQLQKEKREATFVLDEVLVELKSIYADPEQILITSEMLRRVQQAIKELPPKCQLIFKLVKEDGLKYKEVAELLNLSIKTIENQMTIALRRIGAFMQFNIPIASLKN